MGEDVEVMGEDVDSGSGLSTGDRMQPQRLKFKHQLLICRITGAKDNL